MASIQGIYIALFGRPADPGGLAFWTAETNDGQDLSALIGRLTAEPEATARYQGLSNEAIINLIYQTLFGRDADPEGLSFFTEQLTSGAQSLETIAINILDGAQGSDLAAITNKISAANEWNTQLDTGEEIGAYAGEEAAAIGRTFLESVTDDTETIPNAEQTQITINQLLAPDEGLAPAEGGDGTGGDTQEPADFIVDPDNAASSDSIFETIQAAVDAASSGQIIEVVDGRYEESVLIGKDIVLRAQNEGGVTIVPVDGPALTLSTTGNEFAEGGNLSIDGINVDSGVRQNSAIVIYEKEINRAKTEDSDGAGDRAVKIADPDLNVIDHMIGSVTLENIAVSGKYDVSFMTISGYNDLSDLTLDNVTLGGGQTDEAGFIGLFVEPLAGGAPTQNGEVGAGVGDDRNEETIQLLQGLGFSLGAEELSQIAAPEELDLSGVTIDGQSEAGAILASVVGNLAFGLGLGGAAIPDELLERLPLPTLDSLVVAPFGTQDVTGTQSGDVILLVNTDDTLVAEASNTAGEIDGAGGSDIILHLDLADQANTIKTEGDEGDIIINIDFGNEGTGGEIIETGGGGDIVFTASLPSFRSANSGEKINTGDGDDSILHLIGASQFDTVDGGAGTADAFVIGNAPDFVGPEFVTIRVNGESGAPTSILVGDRDAGNGPAVAGAALTNVEIVQIVTSGFGDKVIINGEFGADTDLDTAVDVINLNTLANLAENVFGFDFAPHSAGSGPGDVFDLSGSRGGAGASDVDVNIYTGAGADDIYKFGANTDLDVNIIGFEKDQDLLDFSGSGLSDFDQLSVDTTGDDTIITFGEPGNIEDTTITVVGVDLQASDFSFGGTDN